jgi:hypothetical protein
MVAPYFCNRVNRMNQRWEITQVGGDPAEAKFFRGDYQVYKFSMASMIALLAVIGGKTHSLHCLPVSIHCREDVHRDIIGREIYYREIPAIITDFDGENGRVRVRSDSPKYVGFPPEPWDGPEGESSQDVWEDLLSPKIHWHRTEDV